MSLLYGSIDCPGPVSLWVTWAFVPLARVCSDRFENELVGGKKKKRVLSQLTGAQVSSLEPSHHLNKTIGLVIQGARQWGKAEEPRKEVRAEKFLNWSPRNVGSFLCRSKSCWHRTSQVTQFALSLVEQMHDWCRDLQRGFCGQLSISQENTGQSIFLAPDAVVVYVKCLIRLVNPAPSPLPESWWHHWLLSREATLRTARNYR